MADLSDAGSKAKSRRVTRLSLSSTIKHYCFDSKIEYQTKCALVKLVHISEVEVMGKCFFDFPS